MKIRLNIPAVLAAVPLVLISALLARAGFTCFQDAYPVTYLPIPLCSQGTSEPTDEGGFQCYKYILDSPYGFYCRNVADGAIGCELVTAPAGLTYDEEWGECTHPGYCSGEGTLYLDVPLGDLVALESSCVGG